MKLLGAILLGGLLAACRAHPAAVREAAETPEARGVAIAGRVLDEMGGAGAWARTRCISWNFMGRRRLLWDRRDGIVRVESGDRTCVVHVATKEGRVFERGVEVLDPEERAEALETAYGAFVNDAYWMFMPYKLLDPGVRLVHAGERTTKAGRAADVLEMTFEEVGLTPRNRYLVYVGKESGLVEQWDFFADRKDESPRLSTPWDRWKRFGAILLCTDHGDGNDWEIAVLDEPPPGAFDGPSPADGG